MIDTIALYTGYAHLAVFSALGVLAAIVGFAWLGERLIESLFRKLEVYREVIAFIRSRMKQNPGWFRALRHDR